MEALVLVGRILFSAIFIMSGLMGHIVNLEGTTQYAASQGIPAPRAMVLVTGLMLLLGGLMVLLGFKGRIGALLLVLFLIPAAFLMHPFWGISDPMAAAMQQAHFMKNISLAGAALLIMYFGTGPYSMRA